MTDEQNQGHVPATRRKVRSGEDFDIIIGFLGFWAVVLLVVTVWMEVTAQAALGWALGLLAMLLALYGMIRLRRRLPSRTASRRALSSRGSQASQDYSTAAGEAGHNTSADCRQASTDRQQGDKSGTDRTGAARRPLRRQH